MEESSPVEIKIPPLPATFAEVVQLYRSDADVPDSEHLVTLVERDAATAALVLRHANSAYYGLRRPATTVGRAVTVLGFMPVCNLVLSVGLRQAFEQLEQKDVRGIYGYVMKTSVATAAFARDLALHLKLPAPDTTFAAGLLHQIGRLVLLFSNPLAYATLWYGPGGALTAPLPRQEQEQLGHSYLKVGDEVAEAWRLPDELRAVIRHHLQPMQAPAGDRRLFALLAASAMAPATALYDDRAGQGSTAFFGLSAPLAAFARSRGLVARDLMKVFVERREAVAALADSLISA